MKIQVWKAQNWCNQKGHGYDFSTSSYHNSINIGPIDMFFTKKCNYFSQATRRNHPFLSQSPKKWCFGTLYLFFSKKIMDFSKLDCSTSSYRNSTITGPIDIFFTKKCNYFSQAKRWNHSFLFHSQ